MPLKNSPTESTQIAVVIINYNGLSDTLECLESIFVSKRQTVRVIVVENGSENHARDAVLSRFKDVTYIKSEVNSGWSGGNNLGIKEALRPGSVVPLTQEFDEADIVLLLNNDTVVSEHLFETLEKAFHQSFDIFGPVINDYYTRDVVQTEGVRFNGANQIGFFQSISLEKHQTPPAAPNITAVDIVNGCAVAISKKVFEKIGLIDERFFLICEESDFCLRAQAAGFRLGVIDQALVWHKHSVAFARAGKPLQRYYGTRNLFLLLFKHYGGEGRRGAFASFTEYFRHVYHIYCHEKELNNPQGSSAVMIGVADAICNRFGDRKIKPSLLSRAFEWLASMLWRTRGGRIRHTNGDSQASRA